jgi:hypothetical protein
MYNCSICNKEVFVDHITKPKCCEGGTILAWISGQAHWSGNLNATTTNNNVSEVSAQIIQQMITFLIANEVFKLGKDSVFVKDSEIVDRDTGRKFTFSLDIK